jgi:hypothetical protein
MAEALEQQPEPLPVDLLTYHYARSPAQDKALLHLEQDGDRAQAQYANAAAEGYFCELVDRLDGMGRALHTARTPEACVGPLHPWAPPSAGASHRHRR